MAITRWPPSSAGRKGVRDDRTGKQACGRGLRLAGPRPLVRALALGGAISTSAYTRRTRRPPHLAIGIKPGRQIHIGQRARRTEQTEQGKTAQRRRAFQPPIAIGEFIVEDEIAGHGGKGGDGLRQRELAGEDGRRLSQRQLGEGVAELVPVGRGDALVEDVDDRRRPALRRDRTGEQHRRGAIHGIVRDQPGLGDGFG